MKDCAIILFSATIRLAIQRSCCTNRFFLLVQQFLCADDAQDNHDYFCIKKGRKKGKPPFVQSEYPGNRQFAAASRKQDNGTIFAILHK